MAVSNSSLYKYKVEMYLIVGGTAYNIDSMHILDIITNYDYVNLNMPTIIVSATISNDMIKRLVDNRFDGYIKLKIMKFNSNSGNILTEKYIDEDFNYFISESVRLDQASETAEDHGVNNSRIDIGLLSKKLVEYNTKEFSGSINGDSDNFSLVNYILGDDIEKVIEPFNYITRFTEPLLIPYQDSKAKMLSYLNTHVKAFYDTKYRYFTDFDFVYLLSSSGTRVPTQYDDISKISIVLEQYGSRDSADMGTVKDTKNETYLMFAPEQSCRSIVDGTIYKNYSNIVGIDTETGEQTNLEISDKSVGNKRYTVRVYNKNTEYLSNIRAELLNSTMNLFIMLESVDCSLFTMNKWYSIEATKVYGEEFTGHYLLNRRREFFVREDDNTFRLTIMLDMSKIIT